MAICISAWIALNTFYKNPVPTPLWTKADLPQAPPNGTNGWNLIKDDFDKNPDQYKSPNILGGDASRTIVDEIYIPISDATEKRPAMENLCESVSQLGGDFFATRREFKIFMDAIRHPHFVDTTYLKSGDEILENRSPSMAIHDLFKLSYAYVIATVCDGDHEKALEELSYLTHAAYEYSKTAIPIPKMIGALNIMVSLETANLIINSTDEATHGKGFDSFISTIETMDLSTVRIHDALVSEYLLLLDHLDRVFKPSGFELELSNFVLIEKTALKNQFLFDKGSTVSQLNDLFRKLDQFASAPHELSDGEKSVYEFPEYNGLRLWIYNPAGKLLLRIFRLGYADRIMHFEDDIGRAKDLSASILARKKRI